ncbi:MAG: DUF6090 family protein [Rhodanobacteraceae bacterium]
MIFRRFAQRFRQQQWGAIATELVIVIIGVFIGMQVTNWNEERETNQRAAVFTAHLKTDLREEDWRYQLILQYSREVRANAERALAGLEERAPVDDETLMISAYRASQYMNLVRTRATYDELISTGAIALIRDQALRDTAMRVYNDATIINLVREGMDSRYRAAFRMAVPLAVQRALGRHCGDRLGTVGDYSAIEGVLDYPCKPGLSARALHEAAAALRGNPAVVPALRKRIVDLDTRITNLTVTNKRVLDELRSVAGQTP